MVLCGGCGRGVCLLPNQIGECCKLPQWGLGLCPRLHLRRNYTRIKHLLNDLGNSLKHSEQKVGLTRLLKKKRMYRYTVVSQV